MPKKIVFATEETIVQPSGTGLIVEAPQEQDHVLGATGPEFEVLVPTGQWDDFMPIGELQRNGRGDTFMCVSFSCNNAHEFLHSRLYKEEINKSDTFLGVGSGTVQGRGNSKRTVAEWNRLNGFVLESDRPFITGQGQADTFINDAYAPLTQELRGKGLKQLEYYTFNYKWLPDNGVNSIKVGLTMSPVQVDVLGSYKIDAGGLVIWDKYNPTYAHEVLIFGYEEGKCWHVFDSESDQFLRFAWGYPFGSPMIHSIKKKMKIQLYKKAGQSGIAFKHVSEPSMIVFSGGSVEGGALFQSLYGITDFSQIPLIEVAEWPFPVRHMLNTNPIRL